MPNQNNQPPKLPQASLKLPQTDDLKLTVSEEPKIPVRIRGHQINQDRAVIECESCQESHSIPDIIRNASPEVEQVYRLYAIGKVTNRTCSVPKFSEVQFTKGDVVYDDQYTHTWSGVDTSRTSTVDSLKVKGIAKYDTK